MTVDAIVMTGPATAEPGNCPVVVAAEAPCVMCDGLVYASSCPTGALAPVTATTMRFAEVTLHTDLCWAIQGLDPGCD